MKPLNTIAEIILNGFIKIYLKVNTYKQIHLYSLNSYRFTRSKILIVINPWLNIMWMKDIYKIGWIVFNFLNTSLLCLTHLIKESTCTIPWHLAGSQCPLHIVLALKRHRREWTLLHLNSLGTTLYTSLSVLSPTWKALANVLTHQNVRIYPNTQNRYQNHSPTCVLFRFPFKTNTNILATYRSSKSHSSLNNNI